MKKNTRTTERQKILEAVAISEISEEGRAGTVSLSMEKVKRWRREFENGAKPGHRSTPQEANGKSIYREIMNTLNHVLILE